MSTGGTIPTIRQMAFRVVFVAVAVRTLTYDM